jgi:broad specificity phosphatase PhoE
VRLLLISHAAPGADGELSESAQARAADLGRVLPRPRTACSSPAVCARQTAAALGLTGGADEALADWDAAREPLAGLLARVDAWLGGRSADNGTHAAVTHVAVVRAAVLVVLGAPAAAFGAVDVAPCAVTELGRRDGAWHVARINWEPALLHIPQRRGQRRAKRPA